MSKKSFTLSELLLSVAILGLVFSSILLVFVSSLILNESSRNLTVALTHAKYVMEDIKNTNFNEISSFSWNSTEIVNEGLTSLSNETIVGTVTSLTDYKDVDVTVEWDGYYQTRNITLETLITEP